MEKLARKYLKHPAYV
jgi:ATP-dependent RNA helicase DDX23/PRP28